MASDFFFRSTSPTNEEKKPLPPRRRRSPSLDLFVFSSKTQLLENAVSRDVLSRACRGACLEPHIEPVSWRELWLEIRETRERMERDFGVDCTSLKLAPCFGRRVLFQAHHLLPLHLPSFSQLGRRPLTGGSGVSPRPGTENKDPSDGTSVEETLRKRSS